VAVAALAKSIGSGALDPKEIMLLNITGGGMCRLKENFDLNMLQPDLTASNSKTALEFLEARQ